MNTTTQSSALQIILSRLMYLQMTGIFSAVVTLIAAGFAFVNDANEAILTLFCNVGLSILTLTFLNVIVWFVLGIIHDKRAAILQPDKV